MAAVGIREAEPIAELDLSAATARILRRLAVSEDTGKCDGGCCNSPTRPATIFAIEGARNLCDAAEHCGTRAFVHGGSRHRRAATATTTAVLALIALGLVLDDGVLRCDRCAGRAWFRCAGT